MKTRQIPIVVNGGLDTKTNPKVVRPGSALQLDNMHQPRPGEWRPRNGMTTQPATNRTITSGAALYAASSGVAAIVRGLNNISPQPQPVPARYGTRGTALTGWEDANGTNPTSAFPFPAYACRTDALFGDSVTDLYDGDIGVLGTLQVATAYGFAGALYKIFDGATGRLADYASFSGGGASPFVVCSTTNYLVLTRLTTAGGSPYSLECFFYSASGGFSTFTPVANLVATTGSWFDVVANPGTDTFTIAYRASSGGVSFVVVSAAAGGSVLLGPANSASADATMALGFLGNASAWGGGATLQVLVTAGATDGVAYRLVTISPSIVVGPRNTIDATATANVRQVTGHVDGFVALTALWEVSDVSSRVYDTVKRARVVSGLPTVVTLAPSFSLYSRTALGADGKWYFVGAYDSPVQASYGLVSVDSYYDNRAAMLCQVMASEGGGRRATQSNLASLIASGSTFTTALPRKKRVTVANVSASQGRVQQRATFTDVTTTMSHPRELGGVTYLPGGSIYADDGQSCRTAVFPRYPETPTAVGANLGGAMTSGKTYGYRVVRRRQDNSGRIIRSAGSVPVNVTLGASDVNVVLTLQNPSLAIGDVSMFWLDEIYRAGPIEDGKTLYNLVATNVYQPSAGNTITTTDGMSDATAALGEAAYFTGNVDENQAPPSTQLLEVNGGRVFVVNAEEPTEVWPSKQSKTQTGVGFAADDAFRVDGDGRGAITALGSLNGQLIVFKDGAIWAIGGAGPDDDGNGSFNPPQLLSRETGVPAGLARSVVSTPDGLMFQSARGIYLLGAGLEYVGAPVEAYTQAANVVDASTVRGYTQARFLMANGRCLVWDYQAKTWSVFLLPVGNSTVVACADTPQGWYYMTADGKLRLEVPGATSDDGVAIVTAISLPHLSFAEYQRVKSLDILIDVAGAHTLSVDAEFNYSGALAGQPRQISLTPATPTVRVQYLPPDGFAKCTAIRPVITVAGLPVNGTFRLTSVTATVGVKGGSHIPDYGRMT